MSKLTGIMGIGAVAGIMLLEVITNRPAAFEPDPISGRVCPALFLARTSSHWLYYTTPTYCAVSWAFAGVLLLACLLLLLDRIASR
jgi:hypothetical protein